MKKISIVVICLIILSLIVLLIVINERPPIKDPLIAGTTIQHIPCPEEAKNIHIVRFSNAVDKITTEVKGDTIVLLYPSFKKTTNK